ncbi:diguanylate cyclase domain-containing protein [Bacillus sp. Marseille-P3661]|uniref:diguanylate cyclase domain-containing protein n=1 Tax=Bacillus sp. Marseille-P3661 TaxID=1936234 RepID=UPI000C8168DB|nr:diguanylate cyclase [Bacillus sp. Marseille-P3661]
MLTMYYENVMSDYTLISLVVLSFVIGIFTSYVAINLILWKLTKIWVVISSVIMGGGIWSMHFISMLAFHINIKVHYNITMIILSLIVSIIFSFLSFKKLSTGNNKYFLVCGLLMGVGISSMHYAGMAAMEMDTKIVYSPILVITSIIIAIIMSVISFWIISLINKQVYDPFKLKITGAVLLGLSIALMHFVGMGAANFVEHTHNNRFIFVKDYEVSGFAIGLTIGLFLLLVLVTILITSIINEKYTIKLKESEKLYRQLVEGSPEPIIVYQNEKVVFVNDKLEELIGYKSEEIIGRSIFDFIHADYNNDVRRRIQKIFVDKRVERMELKILAKDNKILDIEVSSALIMYNSKPSIEVFLRDVTEKKMMEEELRKNDERYRFIAENSTELISSFKPNGDYEYISPSCCQILGYDQNELINRNMFDFIHPDEFEIVNRLRTEMESQLEVVTFTHRFRKEDGTYIWLETNARTIRTSSRTIEKLIAVSRDITERLEKENKLHETIKVLEYLSNMDALTSIPNRRFFEERLQSEWNRSMRNGNPLSALMIDIDHFKNYNDFYGHQEGDRIIKQIALVLMDTVKKPSDFVARYGGEEFIVLLPDTDKKGATHIAKQMINNVRNLKVLNEVSSTSPFVTISIGSATVIPEKYTQPNELIKQADIALYHAKEQGRNCFIIS